MKSGSALGTALPSSFVRLSDHTAALVGRVPWDKDGPRLALSPGAWADFAGFAAQF